MSILAGGPDRKKSILAGGPDLKIFDSGLGSWAEKIDFGWGFWSEKSSILAGGPGRYPPPQTWDRVNVWVWPPWAGVEGDGESK